MTQKTKLVKTYLPPDLANRLRFTASEQGLSESSFVKSMIEVVVGTSPEPDAIPSKARREGKVTIRLPEDVYRKHEDEARAQGYPLSSWAAALISARHRNGPQPLRNDRRIIQKGFRQLRGIAVNINQIAAAVNRGRLTGVEYTPSQLELVKLREEVAALRGELRAFAAGQYKFQTGRDMNNE